MLNRFLKQTPQPPRINSSAGTSNTAQGRFGMFFSQRNSVVNNALAKAAAIGKSQAMIEFNLDGTIVTANDNFLAAMGYRLDEIRGKHHGMFVDPAERESRDYREFWAGLNRGEFQAAQYKRFGKGGKESGSSVQTRCSMRAIGRPA